MIYELPVGLIVAPECLGATGSIIVSGTAGEIFLPTADWSTAEAIGASHPPDLGAPRPAWPSSARAETTRRSDVE